MAEPQRCLPAEWLALPLGAIRTLRNADITATATRAVKSSTKQDEGSSSIASGPEELPAEEELTVQSKLMKLLGSPAESSVLTSSVAQELISSIESTSVHQLASTEQLVHRAVECYCRLWMFLAGGAGEDDANKRTSVGRKRRRTPSEDRSTDDDNDENGIASELFEIALPRLLATVANVKDADPFNHIDLEGFFQPIVGESSADVEATVRERQELARQRMNQIAGLFASDIKLTKSRVAERLSMLKQKAQAATQKRVLVKSKNPSPDVSIRVPMRDSDNSRSATIGPTLSKRNQKLMAQLQDHASQGLLDGPGGDGYHSASMSPTMPSCQEMPFIVPVDRRETASFGPDARYHRPDVSAGIYVDSTVPASSSSSNSISRGPPETVGLGVPESRSILGNVTNTNRKNQQAAAPTIRPGDSKKATGEQKAKKSALPSWMLTRKRSNGDASANAPKPNPPPPSSQPSATARSLSFDFLEGAKQQLSSSQAHATASSGAPSMYSLLGDAATVADGQRVIPRTPPAKQRQRTTDYADLPCIPPSP